MACISHHVARRSAREGRQDEARAAWRAQVYLKVHRARQASATKSWRSYRVLRPSGGVKCRPGSRARGASVLSKRMARHCPAPRLPQIKRANHGLSQSQALRRKPQPTATRPTRHESRPLWPFGSPWVRKGRTTKKRRPDRRARRQGNASLPASVRNCAVWGGYSFCTVTASLLTSAHYCPEFPGIARGGGGCP